MSKLVVKLNNDVVDHIDLKQGDMKIGRKPGCDISIDNLAVSGEHANIFTIGEDSFIQDLKSTNGTFINNKKITKHHLRNGDTVTIGNHSLVYLNDKQREMNDDLAKTVVISAQPQAAPAPVNEPASTPAPAKLGATGRHGAIFVLDGTNSGKRIDLSKNVTNLGKTGKHAATITHAGEGYVLAAGAQDEKPKLNGRPVGSEGAKLRNGDIIEVAGTRLQFYFK